MAHPQFEAGNLISDPIHGHIELTKRLTPEQSGRAGLAPESVAEEDLLDTPWLQRLRRISQLQSARWVFPTAEHSRFTHCLGVMHEAGLWGRALYPTLREVLLADTLAEGEASEDPIPSEPLVVETLRMAGLLHHGGPGPGPAGRAGPLRRGRVDRAALDRLPHLEAAAGRPDHAPLGAPPAAALQRPLHRRQPRLRPARRLHDRRLHGPRRRRPPAPVLVHERARPGCLRAGAGRAGAVSRLAADRVQHRLLPPHGARHRPRSRGGLAG